MNVDQLTKFIEDNIGMIIFAVTLLFISTPIFSIAIGSDKFKIPNEIHDILSIFTGYFSFIAIIYAALTFSGQQKQINKMMSDSAFMVKNSELSTFAPIYYDIMKNLYPEIIESKFIEELKILECYIDDFSENNCEHEKRIQAILFKKEIDQKLNNFPDYKLIATKIKSYYCAYTAFKILYDNAYNVTYIGHPVDLLELDIGFDGTALGVLGAKLTMYFETPIFLDRIDAYRARMMPGSSC
jgi:hypothetical protein